MTVSREGEKAILFILLTEQASPGERRKKTEI
jgi:hypothetical protein